ncbi:hypothetical protein MKK75_17580 [Methylobacterium sp. J-030]|uniref:hypothetical protein n=1 Tax=Methylobacterium sp. J-030 TaxID=2836627 RepID=UPI001FBA683F|nr:hypothetical protein [Methylobacterium sp. J-030]MCJ2070583.1 hypothetical protein [Methylobacterium sp. J-030]
MVDAAAYDREGVMVGLVNKAVAVPHLGMAFATRGAVATRRTMAEELEAYVSFDDVVAGVPAALREAYDAGAFWSEDSETEFDLVLMGWSTARRCVELQILSTVAHGGVPPFTLQAMAVTLAPLPDNEALRSIGLKVGRTFDLSRPAEKLLDVIELQRRTPGPIGTRSSAPTGFAIGGAAVLTEVTEAGIVQRVVRRWPDQIGTRITPEGVEAPRQPPQLRVVA